MYNKESSFFSNYDLFSFNNQSPKNEAEIIENNKSTLDLDPSITENVDLGLVIPTSITEENIISTQESPNIETEIVSPEISDNLQTTQSSIVDIEQKFDQIERIRNGMINPTKNQKTGDNNTIATSNNISNNYNNVTNISADYLRGLRSEYHNVPHWREWG